MWGNTFFPTKAVDFAVCLTHVAWIFSVRAEFTFFEDANRTVGFSKFGRGLVNLLATVLVGLLVMELARQLGMMMEHQLGMVME